MKRMFLAGLVALFGSIAGAQSFTPVEGIYWDPEQSGTGYAVSVQNGVMVTQIYSYTPAGDAQWYLVHCEINTKAGTCSGRLDKYVDGQSIGGSYVPPVSDGDDGKVKFTWKSESSIEAVLPLGRIANLVPLDFKRYEGAAAMLGTWVFVAFPANGSTAATPVLKFVAVVDGRAVTADGMARCTPLPKQVFACELLDIDFLPKATWLVKQTVNSARGTTGNILDGNVPVQGWRLNPAFDAGLPDEVNPL